MTTAKTTSSSLSSIRLRRRPQSSVGKTRQGAKRPVAKRLGGETSKGREVLMPCKVYPEFRHVIMSA